MRLSVIIPIYNVEKYLEQCLNSVLSQSFQDFEVICVDDCSTDNSLNIIKNFQEQDKRIKVINNDKNLGLGISRNKGLEESQGEYIHFFDGDDWIENNSYQVVFNKLDTLNMKPDILFFRYRRYDNNSGEYKDVPYNNNNILNTILNPKEKEIAFDNWDRYVWCKFHKRSFLKENEILFNDYHCMEDVEYAAEVYTKCNSLCYLNDVVVNYRINRKNSLVTEYKNCLVHIIKSTENNKIIYETCKDTIKNRLLGFDYFLIKEVLISNYNKGLISTLELIKYIQKVNTPSVKNYVYKYLPSNTGNLKISFIKIFLRKHFKTLFYLLVKIRKFYKKG